MYFQMIVGYLFLASGTAVIVLSCWNAALAVQSRKWPECSGTVMTSALEETHDSEGNMYRAAISYRYVVGGDEFVGKRVRFCDSFMLSWSSPAARIVQAYSAGTAVAVRYDPDDPSESVLEPGFNSFIFSSGFLGAVFLVMGFFAVFNAA
jgi:hypothetical protein